MSFALDPRLAADTRVIGDLPLSRALLMNDARYPWVILTPRQAGATEILDLDAGQRAQLMEELALAAETLRSLPDVEKINIGMLGNITPQLHAHIVGRHNSDPAWPGPVWGVGRAIAYEATKLDARLDWLRTRLKIG